MRRQLCQGFGVLEVALRGVPQEEGSAEEGTCHHLYIAFLLCLHTFAAPGCLQTGSLNQERGCIRFMLGTIWSEA